MPAPFSLHVLPPAFSLPSIDAECLAAIAYLTWAVPSSTWTLVAESGYAENQVLPCLRDVSNGKRNETIVYGFDAIVKHLRQASRGQWDLDARLSSLQRADCAAFTSHLNQTLSPLVDLSLYICSENYDNTTRAAYSASLSFPESWAVPPSRQKIAQARTAHLGFEPADLYNPSPRPSPTRGSRSTSNSPPLATRTMDGAEQGGSAGYFNPMRSRSMADRAVTAARLTALIEEALQPLATIHESNGHRFLLSDSPSTLDCHAAALFALALLPSLSHPFLADGFTKFTSLEKYTRGTIREAFGPPVTASDALVRAPYQDDIAEEDDDSGVEFEIYENANIGSGDVQLPWRRARRDPVTIAKSMVTALVC